jgi:hypothetical protein
MALTTASTLAIRAADDDAASPYYKGPIIQTVAQLNGDSSQIVCTVLFSNTAGVAQAAAQLSLNLSDLDAIDGHVTDAYNALMDALDQYVQNHLEGLAENASATITYTGRA